MEDYSTPTEPLHVVYAHTLQLAPRVRQFADFAIEHLRAQWRW
jgi:DNA-binding transcriptional LysR family regulator